jgi:hypothetical protein
MPTNRNELVWSSGTITHTGGGNDALVVVPVDQDLFDVTVEVAASTTAQVQVTHDSYEAILGITERPLRYTQAAINDLGASGELRLNAASGQDFTDDGWAVGDTFEVITHVVPDFNDPSRVSKKPTTLGDKQVYTVSSVAADVLAFSEDPAITLAEGEIVVALSRAAVAEDSLNWAQVGVDVVGASTDHFNISTACAVRVIASAGTGAIIYNFSGRMQSTIRPAPFQPHANPGPFSGPQGLPAALGSVADDTAVTWDEVVTGGPNGSRRQARATIAGANFTGDGVQNYDKLFFGGHSDTGNHGLYTVDSRDTTTVTMKEPLHGIAGADTGRVKLRHLASERAFGLDSDYTETVLAHLAGNTQYYPCQDGVLTPLTGVGPHSENVANFGSPVDDGFGAGPFGNTRSYSEPTSSEWEDGNGVTMFSASETGAVEGWFRLDELKSADATMISVNTDGIFIGVTATEEIFMDLRTNDTPALADPGAWLASTAYSLGDRVRPVADNSRVYEAEVAGTSGTCEPTFPTDGSTVVDGGTLTWRDVGLRTAFHKFDSVNGDRILSGHTMVVGEWVHVAGTRESDNIWRLYVNGSLAGSFDPNTGPGSFGTPVRAAFTIAYSNGAQTAQSDGNGGEAWNGGMAHILFYDSDFPTAAQIQAHYDKAVELGLN